MRLRLARGLLVLGVVAGLVGMHGRGESAVFGCHAPASGSTAAHHGSAVRHAGDQHAASHWDGHQHSSAVGHGEVCKPVLPSWPAWLPVLACVALLPLATPLAPGTAPWRPRTRLRSWWRAPPRAGRVCLLRVCVSRT